MKKLITTALTTTAALGLAAGPAAAAGGADNVVNVVDTQSQPPMARASLQVAFDPGPQADNQNAATAQSTDCSGCRAMATAVQFVVVEGSPGSVEPHNAATAANGGCDGCASYAYARQVLIWTDGMAQLSPGARYRLGQIQQQMQDDLVAAEPQADQMDTLTALSSELDSLSDQAQQVVIDDLHSVGRTAAAGAPSQQAARA